VSVCVAIPSQWRLRNFSCFHAKCKSSPVMYIVASYRIADMRLEKAGITKKDEKDDGQGRQAGTQNATTTTLGY